MAIVLNLIIVGICGIWLAQSDACGSQCTACKDNLCSNCTDGYYLSVSQCLACNNTTCKTCTNGYECASCSGKWGISCSNNCGTGCIDSTCKFNTGECRCIDGFYGLYCTVNCSTHCKEYACNKTDGSCQCQPGYYGPICLLACPSRCAECDDAFSCTICKAGKYGANCDILCPTECSQGPCERLSGLCNSSMACPKNCEKCLNDINCSSCVVGYYGATCQMICSTNCVRGCYQNTGECHSCQSGRYGQSCQYTCPGNCHDTCQKSDDICYECKTGFFGQRCEFMCPNNCLHSTCFQNNGSCAACSNGYTGSNCNYLTCPSNCDNCLNTTFCTVCKSGYYGREFCIKNCNSRCSSSGCDIDTGNCFECVNTTFFGEICNTSCSLSCVDKECNRTSGDCTKGCVSDNFGNKCQFLCPEYCASIGPGSKCYSNGTCINGCIPNYFGSKCTQTCSKNCANNTNGVACASDGTCTNGCVSNYFGDTCEHACPPNCAPAATGSSCDMEGVCIGGCVVDSYGPTCNRTCPNNCASVSNGSRCSKDGVCTNGCSQGYFGKLCEDVCPANCDVVKYGSRCFSNRTCRGGCIAGYIGDECDVVESVPGDTMDNTGTSLKNRNGPPVPIIAGSVGGVVLLIVIGVIIVVVIMRKRRGKDKPDESANSEVHQTASTNEYHTIDTMPKRSVSEITIKTEPSSAHVISNPNYDRSQDVLSIRRSGASVPSESDTDVDVLEIDEDDRRTHAKRQERTHSPAQQDENVYYIGLQDIQKRKIAVDALAELVASKPFEYFEEEYDKFPFGLTRPHNEARKPDNVVKNRYQGIYAYDDTRVKVKGGKSDYINANFIDGYLKRNAYIASLGPMKKQMGDFGIFWNMIWQYKVERVVMVTNLEEEGKSKCEKYWPGFGDTKVYGDVLVKGLTEDVYAEYTRRTFKITNGSNSRTLHHLHFTAWPDKGIPEDVTALIEFRQRVLRVPAKLGGPTLVHCSAGIGRTGTYIALDILIHEGEAEGAVEIHGCVLNMRRNRVNMVQTAEQYEFLHRALVHALTFDCSPVAADQFQNYVSKTGQQQRQQQFNQLLSIAQHVIPEEQANIARNKSLKNKNRPTADIPGDENRPRLNVRPGTSDYVNAVYIDSFKTKRHYITAQSPLPGTVVDFLSLIYQEDCPCIVSFEHTGERKDVGVYYPADNQILAVGDFTVGSFKMDEQVDNCVLRCIVIEYNKNGSKKRTVTHISYTDWEQDNSVPNSPANFIQLINNVEKMAVTGTHSGPILLHCLDGASKGGLYSVVSTLLQKMEIDHEVSVVNAVRKVKARRRGAIPTQEQFDFCHECVLQFIRSFDIYSNFALK